MREDFSRYFVCLEIYHLVLIQLCSTNSCHVSRLNLYNTTKGNYLYQWDSFIDTRNVCYFLFENQYTHHVYDDYYRYNQNNITTYMQNGRSVYFRFLFISKLTTKRILPTNKISNSFPSVFILRTNSYVFNTFYGRCLLAVGKRLRIQVVFLNQAFVSFQFTCQFLRFRLFRTLNV